MRCPAIAALVVLGALLSARDTLAQIISVPVTLPYPLIETMLADELSTAPGGQAELFNDGKDCNTLSLESPSVAGAGNGLLSLRARLNARGGTPIGSRCVPLFNWTGTLDTELAPHISADGTRLGFRITRSSLEKEGPGQSAVPGVAWDWIKAYVHPEIERLTIDLKPLLEATSTLLNSASSDAGADIAPWLDTVTFSHISGDLEGLEVTLGLELAETLPLAKGGISTAVLTDTEIARWDAAWQSWDAFVAWLIKDLDSQLAARDPALTQALATSFLEARYELRRVLTEEDPARDAVRDLFVSTWNRLAPLLRRELSDDNELAPLKLLTFISAVDALVTVDNVAQQLDIRFDDATFRALARLINSTVTDDQLRYTTDVDPALRRLLGLEPDFEGGEPNSLENLSLGALSLLIPRAWAAALDPALVDRLTGWVPARVELDSYLAAVNLLLDSILEMERTKDRVPAAYLEIHEHLVLATAWQESCWRQFENRDGEVAPLQSAAGSVGMMQVNRHVWRGIYDPLKLEQNIAYNARAGNEILVHYLVDYALKHGEHELPGGADNLAKAAYAMYNGGPRHLSRYRNTTTGGALKKIDAAFWEKYQALLNEGVGAVKACYGS